MPKTSDNIIVFLIVTTGVIFMLVLFLITILYLYRKRQISYLKEVELLKIEYEKGVLKTQVEIQEQTFQSLSRDIHDNINLGLTLAKLNLNTLNLEHKETALDQVNASVKFISSAITDLSDISRSMNSDIIREQGLIVAVRLEVEKLRKLNFFTLRFDVDGEAVFMESEKEVFIFRIIQESFNNILKHAKADAVHLKLRYLEEKIDVVISDNGVGFDNSNEGTPTFRSGAGLRNMRRRAELLNGHFSIRSLPHEGTIINISIPY